MQHTNSFKERYKYWKETGESPYSNGLIKDLAAYKSGKDPVKSSIPYPMLTSSDYDDARAYELGYFDEAGANGHLYTRDYKTGRYLKSPTHPTVGEAMWDDMNNGYDVINKNGQYYSQPNFIKKKTDNMKINPPMLPGYDGGKDDPYSSFAAQMGPILYQRLLKDGVQNIDVIHDYMMRQLAWESNHGRSRVAREQHNYGGYGWNGKTYTTFKDDADFINHYVDLMSKRYSKAMSANSIQEYGRALKEKGYYEDTLEHYTSNLAKMQSISRAVAAHKKNNPDLYKLPKLDFHYEPAAQFQPQLIRIPALNNQYHEQPHQVKYPYVQSNQSITNNQIAIPWEYIQQNNTFRMPALRQLTEAVLNGQDLVGFSGGKSGIYIKPSTRGTFTAAAKQRGMGVQLFASKVLSNPNNYSEAMRKKAQFAHNAASWKH